MANNYFRYDSWIKSAQGPAIAGAQVYVCTQPANVAFTPPSPLAAIYSDPNGLVPITQPLIADGFGHVDFYALQGVYTVVVAIGGVIQEVLPDQSLGGAAASGGGSIILQTNGVTNTDQFLLNLQNLDGTVTLSSDSSGDVTISAASQAAVVKWMIGAGVINSAVPAPSTGYIGITSNLVYVTQFSIPAKLTISTLDGWFVSANPGSTTISIGIYSLSGNQLFSSGAWVLPHNSSYNNQTIAASYVLQPGTYYLAWADSQPHQTVGIANPFAISSLGANNFGSDMSPVLFGTAANPAVSGVIPSTLGVVSAGWPDNTVIPYIIFR